MNFDPTKIALLEEWLQGKEGEHLEFKEWKTKDDFELLARYCCALANEGGGRFIMGVTDRRPRTVVGTISFPQPERTRKGLCDRIPLAIDFEEIQHPDPLDTGAIAVEDIETSGEGASGWATKGRTVVSRAVSHG